MGRAKVVGPAVGGIIVVPLMQKVASAAGLGDIDQRQIPVKFYFAAGMHNSNGVAGANYAIDTGSSRVTQLLASGTAGPTIHTNEGDGEVNISPAIVGFAVQARSASGTPTEEAQRYKDRAPGGADGSLFLQATGVGPGAFDVTGHAIISVCGLPYDADSPVAGSVNKDYPYFSSND